MLKFDKIRNAIRIYQASLAEHIMEDGRYRWEYYGKQRIISQAAINYNGFIVTGTRHTCPIIRMQINSMGAGLLQEWNNGTKGEQGFTDQYGFFLTREEAYVIAKAAGQITRDDPTPGKLFSECYI